MNRIDKWVILNWTIPSITAGIVSYYTAKHFDDIHGILMLILGDLKKLSREVRELIEEKYPEIYEDEIGFFTKLLELELKHLFLKLGKSK